MQLKEVEVQSLHTDSFIRVLGSPFMLLPVFLFLLVVVDDSYLLILHKYLTLPQCVYIA